MWRNFVVLLWFLHISCARRELTSERNGNEDDDLDRVDVGDNKHKTTNYPIGTTKPKGEVVVEKFVDTLMASEKYLKMIETVDDKLTHLETTHQDRSSAILKYLAEVLRVVKASPTDHVLENALQSLKNDLDRLKETIHREEHQRPAFRVVSEGKQPKRKQDRLDNSLWKKEYENELSDAMLAPKRGNVTRTAQSPSVSDNEAIVERLMDTITSSEKYLKKVDSIDFRLNRLDIEIHEKTNTILKHLTEIIKAIQAQTHSDKLEMLDVMKSDISQIRYMVEKHNSPSKVSHGVDNSECNLEATLDARLSFLESHMKSVLSSVEAISTVISEVKNRQHSQNDNKNDNNNQLNQIGSGIDVTSLISEFRRTIQEQKARKCECKMIGRIDRSERYPTDCHEIQAQGFNITGIYKIKPEEIEPFYVLCDLSSAGGGWTVIQNRYDGSQDFLKNWSEYKHGFGNLAGEFWLGLEKVYYLTNQKLYELRIEMEAQNRQEAFASYSVFTIGPEYEGYRISTLGSFRGSAGDSLSYHGGQKFSTYDMDNDEWKEGSCAIEHGGAWWYKECDKSNLNGKYVNSADESNGQSIYWISFKGPNSPLYKTRMMIRPLPASRPFDYTGKARALPDNVKRPKPELKPRIKDPKSAYDMGRARLPYRYDDNVQPDAFFPNYA